MPPCSPPLPLERELREGETRTNNDTEIEINRKVRSIFRVGPGNLIRGPYSLFD
jgi:hypothetical protein